MIAAKTTNARQHRGQNLKTAQLTPRIDNGGNSSNPANELSNDAQIASENGSGATVEGREGDGAIVSLVCEISCNNCQHQALLEEGLFDCSLGHLLNAAVADLTIQLMSNICKSYAKGTGSTGNDLARLEQVIQRGLETFIEVGNALSQIRDRRLYAQSHQSFEEYCKERWGLKQSRAYQLMDAAQAVENLKTSTIVELPKNEAQCRPLTKLPPEQQAEAWQEAVQSAPNGKVTAAHVQQVVEQKFSQVEDIALPKLQQLKDIFSQVGQVEDSRDGKGFAVLRPDLGNPFPLMFRNRQQAWDYWQAKRDVLLGLAGRKPMPSEVDDFAPEAVAAVELQQAIESRTVRALEVDRQCFVVVRAACESFSSLNQLGWSKEAIADVAQQVIEFLLVVEV